MDHVDAGVLLLRVAVGVTIALHGFNKIFRGGRLRGSAGWFEALGMHPGWRGAAIAGVVGLGSAAVLLAVSCRPAAAPARSP